MALHKLYFASPDQTQSIPRKITILLSEYKHLVRVSCVCVRAHVFLYLSLHFDLFSHKLGGTFSVRGVRLQRTVCARDMFLN